MNSTKLHSVISQEIRTQMSSIVGLSFLIESSDVENNFNLKFSDHVFRTSNYLIRLFENFLDTENTERNNPAYYPEKCNLNETVEKIFSDLRSTIIQDFNGRVNIQIRNNRTERHEVPLDNKLLSRILGILAQNAIRNSQEKCIVAGCLITDEDIEFFVTDLFHDYMEMNEYLEGESDDSILSKFYDSGTAVNLALAKKNVGKLGGKIWIEPSGNAGTEVHFSVLLNPCKVQ